MRVAYFDAFSGVSGDMTVGALIDAGADAHKLIHILSGSHTKSQKIQNLSLLAVMVSFHSAYPRRAEDRI